MIQKKSKGDEETHSEQQDREREVSDAQKKEAIEGPIREAADKRAKRIAYETPLVNPFTGIVEHPDGRRTHLDSGLPFEEDVALKSINMLDPEENHSEQ